MDPIGWLALANAIIWFGIGGYLAFIAVTQRRLARRLQQLEILRDADQRK